MGTTPISRIRPDLPNVKATYDGRPVAAVSLMNMAALGNYLAGSRFLRSTSTIHDWPVAATGIGATPASTTYYLRHPCDDDATYLWVWIAYHASAYDSAVVISTDTPDLADRATFTGADAGTTLSVANGALVQRRLNASSPYARPSVAHTGFVDEGTTSTLVVRPRPLYVGGIAAGSDRDIEIALACTNVRIDSSCIWEIHQPSRTPL